MHSQSDSADEVRNGSRWEIAAVDTAVANSFAAERLPDDARFVFDEEVEH